ncbi:Fic family protein [Microbacterium proteolyticum]|uniref:Fic family protein n=1 Tax=Microbacterium proteolyticum TaxID=1572644 RepID=UPI0024172CF1|nr:Fic family protein [Microbacterium proteolyticum]
MSSAELPPPDHASASESGEQPDSSWPAIDHERREWVPAAAMGVRAARAGRASVAYDASVPPMIASRHPVLLPEVAADADEAAAELARFDAELGSRVAGFAPVLLRSEAASSSQIENLTASARAIFSAELGAKGSRNAELIAANTRSLQAALDLAEQITPASIAAMHRVLMESQPRHTPGEYRREQNWIGTRGDSPVGAEFVPPHHERVAALINDLAEFAARWDVPSLTSVAIAHAQFETIHPYTDGNGRTGRALAQSMLRYRGVTRNVAVPVSAGLLADVDGYHSALTAYRAGDPNPIVRAFASAAFRAVSNSRELVSDIDTVRGSWNDRLTARRDSSAWRLLDIFASRPVLDSATAAGALGIAQPNVYPPLKALVDAGIVRSKAEHKLGPFWRSEEILEALDAFAARAGRRQRV